MVSACCRPLQQHVVKALGRDPKWSVEEAEGKEVKEEGSAMLTKDL